jgi:hypothetical protein
MKLTIDDVVYFVGEHVMPGGFEARAIGVCMDAYEIRALSPYCFENLTC